MCGVPIAITCVWVFEELCAAHVLPSMACNPHYSAEGRTELRSRQGGDAGPIGEVGIQHDSGFTVGALFQSVGARSQDRALGRKKKKGSDSPNSRTGFASQQLQSEPQHLKNITQDLSLCLPLLLQVWLDLLKPVIKQIRSKCRSTHMHNSVTLLFPQYLVLREPRCITHKFTSP